MLFIGPGETFERRARREIEGIFDWVRSPKFPLDCAEIEFSASPQFIFQAAEGLPEDYGTHLIDWALAQSSSVVICVDIATLTGGEEGVTASRPRELSDHNNGDCAHANHCNEWPEPLRQVTHGRSSP